MTRSLPILLLAAILLSACGTTPTPSAQPSAKPTTTTTAKPDPMAGWAYRFCAMDSQLSSSLPHQPLASVGSSAPDQQALVAYVEQAQSVLTQAKTEFTALSPAPVPDANAMLTSYRQTIDSTLASLTKDLSVTAKASPGDMSMYADVDEAELTVFQVSELDVVSKAVKAHPDLKSALAGMPGCRVYAN